MPQTEYPPKRAVVERAVGALRDVPCMVRQQKKDPPLGKVINTFGGEVEINVVSHLRDVQALACYEV